MRIVSKARKASLSSTSALWLFMAIAFSATAAHAADFPTVAPPPMAGPSEVTPGEAGSTLPLPGGNAHSKNNLGPLEDKVTDSIKGTVKQFSSTDNVNLEDLNTAHQAIAKLEVLIEIEKRLAELDKIKSERSGEKNLASSIPASALTPPPPPAAPAFSPPPSAPPMESFSPPPFKSHVDVSRVIGADGHYAAVIQDKTMYVGDTLPDGSVIVSISSRAVETKLKDGSMHQMRVKGVDEVYGHSL